MEKKVVVKIAGIDFAIISNESEEYTCDIAKQVNDKIEILTHENARITRNAATIICAMEFCENALQAKNDLDNLRSQVTSYIDEAAGANELVCEYKRQVESMQREIDSLRERITKK